MADKEYTPESPPSKDEKGVKAEYASDAAAGEGTNGELHTVDKGYTEVYAEASHEEQARVLRKVDYRLVPLLTLLYLVSFVDRSNIGNAKIAGLTDDLNLKGLMYNTALTVFFVPYALFEIPSNVVLKILRPSIWISILLFSWGTVMTLMGTVNSYGGLIACRFFLGVTESGFFPGATFLLTLWYKRYEVQRRMAVFYAAASLSGAFSGLLAFGIETMKGDAGLNGWQWIFIIEGFVPVFLSLFVWKLLPDNPETAHFLTKDEKELIINRLALETGSGRGRVTNSDRIQWKYIRAALAEWKTWAAVIMFWGNSIGVYGFTATVPTFIEELGYSQARAQLLTIPIYVFACIMTIVFAFASDYYGQRSPFIVGGFSIAIVGFVAQLAIPHPDKPGLAYGFLFAIAAGLYSPFISIVCWTANNAAPSSKRAIAMALLIACGNLGGIAGSNVFLAREAPAYPTGFGVCLGMDVAAVCMAFFLRWVYARENGRRKAFLEQHGEDEIRSRYTEEELVDMGDKSPFFIYTL